MRLADVAEIGDGPDETTDYVRHGWGPARRFAEHAGSPGTLVGARHDVPPEPAQAAGQGGGHAGAREAASQQAVTIAISKQRGSNAVRVAADILARAEVMAREVLPDDMELVVTRNAGLTADEKVNELVEALAVALVIVVALLAVAMGWREVLVVAVAVPVVFGLTLVVNMLVAFTITPWLSYHVLGGKYRRKGPAAAGEPLPEGEVPSEGLYDHAAVQQTLLYRIFLPLIRSRAIGYGFLLLTAFATLAAAGMGALRMVPLKMLPFDNKNELLLLVDMDEGRSLERTRAVVARLEEAVAAEPEVIDFPSHTGIGGPIDFNGLVRHYGLRSRPHEAEIRVNLVAKKHRTLQSHGLGLRMRDDLERLGRGTLAGKRPPSPPPTCGPAAASLGACRLVSA